MASTDSSLPDPTLPAAALWLKSIDREYLHRYGWEQANRDFHGLALAARPFIARYFDDPKEQEAAFDGLALALTALSHFADIEQLASSFANDSSTKAPEISEKLLPPPVS